MAEGTITVGSEATTLCHSTSSRYYTMCMHPELMTSSENPESFTVVLKARSLFPGELVDEMHNLYKSMIVPRVVTSVNYLEEVVKWYNSDRKTPLVDVFQPSEFYSRLRKTCDGHDVHPPGSLLKLISDQYVKDVKMHVIEGLNARIGKVARVLLNYSFFTSAIRLNKWIDPVLAGFILSDKELTDGDITYGGSYWSGLSLTDRCNVVTHAKEVINELKTKIHLLIGKRQKDKRLDKIQAFKITLLLSDLLDQRNKPVQDRIDKEKIADLEKKDLLKLTEARIVTSTSAVPIAAFHCPSTSSPVLLGDTVDLKSKSTGRIHDKIMDLPKVSKDPPSTGVPPQVYTYPLFSSKSSGTVEVEPFRAMKAKPAKTVKIKAKKVERKKELTLVSSIAVLPILHASSSHMPFDRDIAASLLQKIIIKRQDDREAEIEMSKVLPSTTSMRKRGAEKEDLSKTKRIFVKQTTQSSQERRRGILESTDDLVALNHRLTALRVKTELPIPKILLCLNGLKTPGILYIPLSQLRSSTICEKFEEIKIDNFIHSSSTKWQPVTSSSKVYVCDPAVGKDTPVLICHSTAHFSTVCKTYSATWTLSSDEAIVKVQLPPDVKKAVDKGKDLEICLPNEILSLLLETGPVADRLQTVSCWLEFLLKPEFLREGSQRKRSPITKWMEKGLYYPAMEHTTDGYSISIRFHTFHTVRKKPIINGSLLVKRGYTGILPLVKPIQLMDAKAGIYREKSIEIRHLPRDDGAMEEHSLSSALMRLSEELQSKKPPKYLEVFAIDPGKCNVMKSASCCVSFEDIWNCGGDAKKVEKLLKDKEKGFLTSRLEKAFAEAVGITEKKLMEHSLRLWYRDKEKNLREKLKMDPIFTSMGDDAGLKTCSLSKVHKYLEVFNDNIEKLTEYWTSPFHKKWRFRLLRAGLRAKHACLREILHYKHSFVSKEKSTDENYGVVQRNSRKSCYHKDRLRVIFFGMASFGSGGGHDSMARKEFIQMLAAKPGTIVVLTDEYFTSQKCHWCGNMVEPAPVPDHITDEKEIMNYGYHNKQCTDHRCKTRKYITMDRDSNAACNILQRGIHLLLTQTVPEALQRPTLDPATTSSIPIPTLTTTATKKRERPEIPIASEKRTR